MPARNAAGTYWVMLAWECKGWHRRKQFHIQSKGLSYRIWGFLSSLKTTWWLLLCVLGMIPSFAFLLWAQFWGGVFHLLPVTPTPVGRTHSNPCSGQAGHTHQSSLVNANTALLPASALWYWKPLGFQSSQNFFPSCAWMRPWRTIGCTKQIKHPWRNQQIALPSHSRQEWRSSFLWEFG